MDFITDSKTIAQVIGISDRQVRNLANDGIIIKVGIGKYDLAESVKNYIKRIEEKTNMSSKDLKDLEKELTAEKVLNERAKRRKAEFIANEIEKTMHKSADVESVFNNIITTAKTKLLALPVKLANELQGVDDFKSIKDIIYKGITSSLIDLANYSPEQYYKNLESADDNDE